MKWNYSINETEEALDFYNENGFVGFVDLLSAEDLAALRKGFDDAVASGAIEVSDELLLGTNDVIFRSTVFEKYANDERILSIVAKIFNQTNGLQLQHTKLNSKPLKDKGAGLIEWH